MEAAGKSALWADNGDLIAGMDGKSTGLVIGRKDGDGWSGMVIEG